MDFAVAGGTGSFDVTSGSNCGWTAASNASWIHVTPGSAASGNGTVRFTVLQNTGGSRTGTITAAAQAFTIRQDGACTFTVSPSSISIGDRGGESAVDVNGGADCEWTATSDSPWLEVASAARGKGNGTVKLKVSRNEGTARTGRATVGGRTVTVSQESGCAIQVRGKQEIDVNRGGGDRSVDVRAGDACAWTASSNVAWIRITRGATGVGDGTVEFNVDRNRGDRRTGTITIGGQSVTIRQRADDDDDDDDRRMTAVPGSESRP
jgi:hypothetical protein